MLPLHQPGKLLAGRPHSAPLANLQLDKDHSAAVVHPSLQVKPPVAEFRLVSARVRPQGPFLKVSEVPAEVQAASLRKQLPAPAGKTFLQQGNKHHLQAPAAEAQHLVLQHLLNGPKLLLHELRLPPPPPLPPPEIHPPSLTATSWQNPTEGAAQ